jgi:SRSO17 transposase
LQLEVGMLPPIIPTAVPYASRFSAPDNAMISLMRQMYHLSFWKLADGETQPIKYWLSTLPENIAFPRLVDIAKLRWRIERDYQELKH